jgi:uncharacterized membrane protein YfcA
MDRLEDVAETLGANPPLLAFGLFALFVAAMLLLRRRSRRRRRRRSPEARAARAAAGKRLGRPYDAGSAADPGDGDGD